MVGLLSAGGNRGSWAAALRDVVRGVYGLGWSGVEEGVSTELIGKIGTVGYDTGQR